MKKLRKAVSLVAVMAIMATMFAAPLGVNAADETNKIIYSSPNLSPNAAVNPPEGFNIATATGEVSNGTTLIKGTYYKIGKDLLGGAGDMTVAYASQAAGVDSKVTINSGAITANAKNLQSNIDSASRILYETNVNVNSNISSVALMMPAGGLQITKNIDLTNYQGKWVNLKIYYQPLMTYAYTVDGIQKSFSTSIMREEGYSSYTADFWKTLLSDSAVNDTYDSTKTYVLKSAVYGNCEAYINGNLVLNSNYPMPSRQSYSTSTIPTRFVFWAADNAKAKTVYYSNIKHSIISNYSSDVQSMSPSTNKLFLIDGFGNLKPLAENVEIAVK